MRISAAKTLNKLTHPAGFSIVEIMVTMMLVVAIFTLIPLGREDNDRQLFEDTVHLMNRSIRFSVNESILRNVLVRMKFKLDTAPVEYIVEYGNGPDVILPQPVDLSRLSFSEKEEVLKKKEKFDNQFTPITEFAEGPQNLPEGIEIFGVGTTYNPIFVTEGEVSIYFYPTGEKDNALFIFNNDLGMATYSIAPFEDKTYHEFIRFNEEEIIRFDDTIQVRSEEEFQTWLKE